VAELTLMGQFWRSQNCEGAIQLSGNKVISSLLPCFCYLIAHPRG
jgi:hypothetical protein